MIKLNVSESKSLTLKGQKIIAALFLVTAHLPERDAMREKIRSLAVLLADAAPMERQTLAGSLMNLLEAAVFSKMISEANARIIESELKYFADPLHQLDGSVSALFPAEPDKGHFLDKKTYYNAMSFTKKTTQSNKEENKGSFTKNKDIRQEKILSYINERKSANIKDISTLFPETSEKTIQRELGALVALGKINKRGNKRWSLYLAI